MGQRVRARPGQVRRDAVYQLSKVGNNLNQLARAANTAGQVRAEELLEEALGELRATASQSPRVRQPVYHLVLSPAPEDRLERRDWLALADRVLEELGLRRHQAVVALHTDTDHPRLHLAVNRVHPGTLRAWDRWQDRPRIEGALRRIERERGLLRVPGRLAGVERGEVGRGREGWLTQGQKAGIRHRAAETYARYYAHRGAGDRRAQRLNPHASLVRLRSSLGRAAVRVAGVRLRSLLSRAAPGLGPVMTVLGMVRRVVKSLELEGDGGRGR